MKSKRGAAGMWGKITRVFTRPSKLIGGTLIFAGILKLIFSPLPYATNGDGFAARLTSALNPANNNPLAMDSAGNNVFSILADGMVSNLPTALGLIIPGSAVIILGKIFKF